MVLAKSSHQCGTSAFSRKNFFIVAQGVCLVNIVNTLTNCALGEVSDAMKETQLRLVRKFLAVPNSSVPRISLRLYKMTININLELERAIITSNHYRVTMRYACVKLLFQYSTHKGILTIPHWHLKLA